MYRARGRQPNLPVSCNWRTDTVFRHFPAKEDLVAAVFVDRMDAYADVVTAALDNPDPWHGFVEGVDAGPARLSRPRLSRPSTRRVSQRATSFRAAVCRRSWSAMRPEAESQRGDAPVTGSLLT